MKLEAKDLRIESLTAQGMIHAITYLEGIQGCYIIKNQFDSSSGTFIPLDEINPIPLTEEWLLRFGAINTYGQTYFIGGLKFDINTMGVVRFHYSDKVVYLDYVHEIQNV
jgi:hypothetical protein